MTMRRFLAAGAVFALAACGSDGDDDSPAATPDASVPGAITYYQNVKPIIDAKCTGCHVVGGIGPFALDSYAAALEHHEEATIAVRAKIMPPWLAADGCSEYVDDRSLSDAQIDTIAAWSEAGAPEGDAAHPGAAIDTGPSSALSRVDLTIPMPAPYLPTTTEHDDYRCFVLDWNEATTKYVTGFRANPGNPQVVHHVIAFYAAPDVVPQIEALDAAEPGQGYTCFGGPGTNDSSWLGAWAPGSRGNDFPAGSGLRIEPGSKIILQVHYNADNGGFAEDTTSIDLRLADTVEKEGRIQPWANPNWLGGGMLIPKDDPDVMHSFQQDLTYVTGGQAVDIWSVGYHQHVRGSHGKVELHRADGSSECMLEVPRWDFHWQGSYGFITPKRFNPGDRLYLECHWDNSAANQPTVDGTQVPSQDLNWGEGTGDEMCLTAVYITPAN